MKLSRDGNYAVCLRVGWEGYITDRDRHSTWVRREISSCRLKSRRQGSRAAMSSSCFYFCVVIAALAVGLPSCTAILTDDEKVEILNAHNYYRRMVSPIATNMEQLEWNLELAYLAQFYVATCEMEEEREDLNSQSTEFDYVGENRLAVASYTVNYTILVQKWFDQKLYFDYYTSACVDADGNEDEDGEACRGYTQLVWARTYAVGCASIRCEELNGAEDIDAGLYLLCFYGPGGSFYGEPPYQTGNEPCSNCPYEKPYCSDKLCVESGAPPLLSQISTMALLLIVGAVSSLM